MDTTRKSAVLHFLCSAALASIFVPCLAQKAPADKKDKDKKPAAQEKKETKPGQPKPYEEVITKDAITQDGMFKVHQVDDKYYFEIPASMFGKELMWQTEMAQVPASTYFFPGTPAGIRVISFSRHGNTVYLRQIDHSLRSAEGGGMQVGVDAASLPSIIGAFPVEAEGKDKSAVIEVTKLYTTDPVVFETKSGPTDIAKSYVDKIKAFPTNIEATAFVTFNQPPDPFLAQFGIPQTPQGMTTLAHYSLVQLPDKPMMGRYFDSRVGYFSTPFQLYGTSDNRVMEKQYISRFRLEKKDPTAPVSDPVKPITFYMSREVPDEWRKWIKQGVEAWQPVFEKVGYSNAIVCVDAPSLKDDPDWDPEDARYSVIRWAPSETENAMGPSIQDPRSGETLSAHIIVWHNVLKLAQNWYFVQASPLDKDAQHYPYGEKLMGPMLSSIITHEVGHTLGLEHNFKASSAYTVAQLRDPSWTSQWGDEASIMDYGRYNYVAQPGDNASLIPKIGPYDYFAIKWGYTPFPNAMTPDDEKVELDKIASEQVDDPMLRFGFDWNDPLVEMEDLGSDAIEANRLGMLNIRRVAKNLLNGTFKYGEDYSLTAELYGELQFQRMEELSHVARLVGGIVGTDYHMGRGQAVYEPLPATRQAAAVTFLNQYAFHTPSELLDDALLSRIQPEGSSDMVDSVQDVFLRSLLSESRVSRMFDLETRYPRTTYTVAQMAGDLEDGVWQELKSDHPKIDPYRRALQRDYLTILNQRLNGSYSTQTELKMIEKDRLRKLAKRIDFALAKTQDHMTGLHLQECRTTIEKVLKPNEVVVNTPSYNFYDMFGISSIRSFCDDSYNGITLEGVQDYFKPRPLGEKSQKH